MRVVLRASDFPIQIVGNQTSLVVGGFLGNEFVHLVYLYYAYRGVHAAVLVNFLSISLNYLYEESSRRIPVARANLSFVKLMIQKNRLMNRWAFSVLKMWMIHDLEELSPCIECSIHSFETSTIKKRARDI